MDQYMKLALESARIGYQNGEGGPFGAAVIKDGVVLAVAHNQVLKNNDPTAHAEIMAIRQACQAIGSHDLSGAILYATGQPCPMCLSAIIWANIKTCYYANTVQDAEKIGFRDDMIYHYLQEGGNLLELKQLGRDACIAMYEDYANRQGTIY